MGINTTKDREIIVIKEKTIHTIRIITKLHTQRTFTTLEEEKIYTHN